MVQYDVEAFMAACERKGLAAKTMGSYEQTLRLFGQFLSVREIERTEEVKRVHIESYIDYLQKRGKYTVCAIDAPANSNNPENRSDYAKKISPTTINNYMRNMKVFFNWCVEQELIYKNPMEKVKYMKVERKPLEFVSDADFKRLLGCMDISKFSEYRDSVIMQTLLDTGMRCGECLQVLVSCVDLQRNCISLPADITKGKKGRYVFFSTKTGKILRRWQQYKDRYRDSEYLFCTNEGKPLQVSNFETNIRKYAQRIGLKNIHPHCFRNNFAKRFLMNGGDIYTLSRILGHSSVTVTEQAYLDVTEEDLHSLYQRYSPLENMQL